MKKVIVFVFFILMITINTYASSGPVKQNSIIECNGTYYGKHGTPAHWHKVEKKNDLWVSVGGEVEIPPCYIKIPNEKEKVTFYKCSDGDTARFIINDKETKVRFLAIDTPEIDKNDPYAKAASDYTCNALKNAKEIYLEYDGSSDKEDKYGRVLAFVYVDNILLEKSLIENGLAKVAYIYGDYEHVEELREAENLAKEKGLGIWSDITLPDKGNTESSDDDNDEKDIVLEIIKFIISVIKKIFALLFH